MMIKFIEKYNSFLEKRHSNDEFKIGGQTIIKCSTLEICELKQK